jgi:ADP-ribosylglycohydrolase
MIGAIAGGIIGSVYEHYDVKTTDFELFGPHSTFTDDTVLTVALADCILHGKDYTQTYREYGRKYPNRGYGGTFYYWLQSDTMGPYGSFGNGSAMRVSPIGFTFDTLQQVLEEAKRSAEVTHNHVEGIKGAQSVAAAVFMCRTGETKEEIQSYLETTFGYNLSRTLDDIRPTYSFDVTCQGSVPEAIIAFIESNDYEDAIRKAISLGGDSDTIACITGGIAQAYYKHLPDYIVQKARQLLVPELLKVIDEFSMKFGLTSI